MSRSLFFIAALSCATAANAGVRIETITRDIKTQVAEPGMQVVMVQDGMIRMNGAKGSKGVIVKSSLMYVLDDEKKSYMEIDKATMKETADQAGAMMKQMQDRMKDMPPEQRAQVEKMLGSHAGSMMSGEKVHYEAKDTGKSETVEGRKCQLWNLLKNGKLHEELCVVPFSSLPGKEDFEKTFKALADAYEGMAAGIPGAADSIKARRAIGGYPVRARSFDDAEQLRGKETILSKWFEVSLPGSTFDIPAGYAKKELPQLPH